MHEISGTYKLPAKKIAVIAGRFNDFIVKSLIEGAIDGLTRHGLSVAQIDIIRVPGAFEIPLVAKQLAQSKNYSGMIALGAVIRGATPHFDYVCGACASGIQSVSLETNIPIMFGVLTTETIDQAIERAGTKAGNKGFDAALALLETLDVLVKINETL